MKIYAIRPVHSNFEVVSFIQVFPAPSWEVVAMDCRNGNVETLSRRQAAKRLRCKGKIAFLVSKVTI